VYLEVFVEYLRGWILPNASDGPDKFVNLNEAAGVNWWICRLNFCRILWITCQQGTRSPAKNSSSYTTDSSFAGAGNCSLAFRAWAQPVGKYPLLTKLASCISVTGDDPKKHFCSSLPEAIVAAREGEGEGKG
jgi:hypothetical protein